MKVIRAKIKGGKENNYINRTPFVELKCVRERKRMYVYMCYIYLIRSDLLSVTVDAISVV